MSFVSGLEHREHVRRWLELMGPPLPHPHHGETRPTGLIKDRTMIKQVHQSHEIFTNESLDLLSY